MKKLFIFLIFLSILFFSSIGNAILKVIHYNNQIDNWSVLRVEGKTLILRSGKRLKTSLYDLKYIGQLQTKTKAPYFILSGRDCNNCDENISIFIWCPDNGPMLANGHQPHYSYPGKEKDYATNTLVYENRMFYGNCSIYGNSVIWIQRSLDNKRKWENSIFIVKIDNETLKEIRLTKSDEIKKLSNRVSKCKELPGIENTTEP